jgi:DNA-binding NarL/FixJ family response regulator
MPGKNGGGKTRVLIAAASSAQLADLERIVQQDSTMNVVGSLSALSIVRQRSAELHPDVILLDIAEPGPQLASLLLRQTGTAVVALVDEPDRNWTRKILRAGVLGILPRNSSATEITSAIHAASRGLLVLEPDVIRALFPSGAERSSDTDIDMIEELTDRELEVLRMLAEGFANKQIASRLGISDHTVKFHIRSILAKLDVSTRTGAVTVGIRKGFILL